MVGEKIIQVDNKKERIAKSAWVSVSQGRELSPLRKIRLRCLALLFLNGVIRSARQTYAPLKAHPNTFGNLVSVEIENKNKI